MLVSVLASGSEGNSTYVETNDVKLLIDLGMTNKYITDRLNELGVKPKDIDYIFMTHSHKDHVGAIPVFIKKNKPKIVVTEKTLKEIEELKDYENLVVTDEQIIVGSTTIDNFKLSHDSGDIRGYIIEDENSSMVYMTDTGYLNQKHFKKLYNKNLYVMEANHDIEMLMNGKYPKWLKQRILSDKGHLSNNASGFYLSKLIGPNTQKVILAHLSKENNEPSVAVETVLNTLKEYDINFDCLEVAAQREKTKEYEI